MARKRSVEDWLRVRTSLHTHQRIAKIAAILGPQLIQKIFPEPHHDPVTRDNAVMSRVTSRDLSHVTKDMATLMKHAVVGMCVHVWGTVRHRGYRRELDLVLPDGTLEYIDSLVGLDGFGHAMTAAGWIVVNGEDLEFPRFFDEHNADPNQRRAADRERQARKRANDKERAQATNKGPRGTAESQVEALLSDYMLQAHRDRERVTSHATVTRDRAAREEVLTHTQYSQEAAAVAHAYTREGMPLAAAAIDTLLRKLEHERGLTLAPSAPMSRFLLELTEAKITEGELRAAHALGVKRRISQGNNRQPVNLGLIATLLCDVRSQENSLPPLRRLSPEQLNSFAEKNNIHIPAGYDMSSAIEFVERHWREDHWKSDQRSRPH